MALKKATTPVLEIGYYEHGPATGWPVILAHGFPYNIHLYDEVVPLLVAQGARIILPYVRGHGPTRFLSPSTMRTGEQAALASDLIEKAVFFQLPLSLSYAQPLAQSHSPLPLEAAYFLPDAYPAFAPFAAPAAEPKVAFYTTVTTVFSNEILEI
ncbi:hypothetical protein R3P38DRAFT_2798374 [Favolaschia claudopus]|uniref:AB hydrolase-1 domain-containing protein n=1 Tax=Favolaschia claudopus TaxID=2862362 RepID=A0AAW0A200_9AGAR